MDNFEHIRARREDLVLSLKYAQTKLESAWAEAENREKIVHDLKTQIDEYDRVLEILGQNG